MVDDSLKEKMSDGHEGVEPMDGETKRLTLFPEQTFFVRTGNTQVGVHGERSPPGVLFRAAIAEKMQEFEECFSGQRVLLDLASQPCLWRWWRLLLY